MLYIETDLPLKELRFELFDINGVLIDSGTIIQKTSLDLRDLSHGFYFMKIVSESGVYLRKIIKE